MSVTEKQKPKVGCVIRLSAITDGGRICGPTTGCTIRGLTVEEMAEALDDFLYEHTGQRRLVSRLCKNAHGAPVWRK